jgi:aspartate aminotransferase
MQSSGMEANKTMNPPLLASSKMADTLIPSEIIKLANEINLKMQSGEQIFNLTIGDFDPGIFPYAPDNEGL